MVPWNIKTSYKNFSSAQFPVISSAVYIDVKRTVFLASRWSFYAYSVCDIVCVALYINSYVVVALFILCIDHNMFLCRSGVELLPCCLVVICVSLVWSQVVPTSRQFIAHQLFLLCGVYATGNLQATPFHSQDFHVNQTWNLTGIYCITSKNTNAYFLLKWYVVVIELLQCLKSGSMWWRRYRHFTTISVSYRM